MKKNLILSVLMILLIAALPVYAATTAAVLHCYADGPRVEGTHADLATLCANVSTDDEVEAVINCYKQGPLLSGTWTDMAHLCAFVKNEKQTTLVTNCFKKGSSLPGTWTEMAILCSRVEE